MAALDWLPLALHGDSVLRTEASAPGSGLPPAPGLWPQKPRLAPEFRGTSSVSLMAPWALGLHPCTRSPLHLGQSSWNGLSALDFNWVLTSAAESGAGFLTCRGIPGGPAFASAIYSPGSIPSHQEDTGALLAGSDLNSSVGLAHTVLT